MSLEYGMCIFFLVEMNKFEKASSERLLVELSIALSVPALKWHNTDSAVLKQISRKLSEWHTQTLNWLLLENNLLWGFIILIS